MSFGSQVVTSVRLSLNTPISRSSPSAPGKPSDHSHSCGDQRTRGSYGSMFQMLQTPPSQIVAATRKITNRLEGRMIFMALPAETSEHFKPSERDRPGSSYKGSIESKKR